jgi:hypothetical protein
MPRPLIKQEPPKRDISLCIVLNRSTQPDLRRVASTNIISLEQRKQELELRQIEAAIRTQEEETRAKPEP